MQCAVDVQEMERIPVSADNSCLFHAVAYLTRSGEHAEPAIPCEMRDLVATRMMKDSDRWEEAVKNHEQKTVAEYANWVKDSRNWGGELDLLVLSEHFGVQFSILLMDRGSLYVSHIPHANQYPCRVYVLLKDKHYDPVIGRTSEGAEVQFFDPSDELAMKKAEDLAKKLQPLPEMTHLVFECQQCGMRFTGHEELDAHVEDTDHRKFKGHS